MSAEDDTTFAPLSAWARSQNHPGQTTPLADSVDALDYRYDCSVVGFSWGPAVDTYNGVSSSKMVGSAESCRRLCIAAPSCFWFSYLTQGLFHGRCILAGEHAVPSWEKGCVAARKATGCDCPSQQASSSDFPGRADVSMLAFGSQRQPFGLECWPKDTAFNLYPCNFPKVLQDTIDGWPGLCLGLAQVELENIDMCEQTCRTNQLCAGWQFIGATASSEGQCWQGVGDHCNTRKGWHDIQVARAQRLQHGEVRVLADTRAYQVMNLWRSSNELGYNGSLADATAECRAECYSDIFCQFWQYVKESGCWRENPRMGRSVTYPLVNGSGARWPPHVEILAGEFIQHFCPEPTLAPTALPHFPTQGESTAGPTLEPCDPRICVPNISRGHGPAAFSPPSATLDIGRGYWFTLFLGLGILSLFFGCLSAALFCNRPWQASRARAFEACENEEGSRRSEWRRRQVEPLEDDGSTSSEESVPLAGGVPAWSPGAWRPVLPCAQRLSVSAPKLVRTQRLQYIALPTHAR